MPLETLELGDARWPQILSCAKADIFYWPEFCNLQRERLPGRAIMLHYHDDLGTVFDVTTLKEVSRLPFFSDVAAGFLVPPIDLASPEYNGPMVVAERPLVPELLRRYRSAVDEYCRQQGVVTEFVRFHPLSEASCLLADTTDLPVVSDMVFVDLRDGYAAAKARYSSKRRQEINRAERNGARMQIVPADEQHLSRFVDLYHASMRRKNAKSVYFYPQEYIRSLFSELGARAILVEAYAGERLASSTIFLLGDRVVWAQYEGTVPELFDSDANLYKTDRMIAWSAEVGYDFFLLGGGMQRGDGMYQYKLRFSSLTAPVRHLRKIHDPHAMDRLLAAKSKYDRKRCRATAEAYFPSYWLD